MLPPYPSGALPPSQLLRKFATHPHQHEPADTLREIGRVERTRIIVDWLLNFDMHRRANTGLNRGEARHALKNASASGAAKRSDAGLTVESELLAHILLTGEYQWTKRR